MIQKIIIIFFLFFFLFFVIRFLIKIKNFGSTVIKERKNQEEVIDLEKDPKTNQYKPKE